MIKMKKTVDNRDADKGGRRADTPADILSNRVATDRRPLDQVRSAHVFRGDISLASPDSHSLDLGLCTRLEKVCAPGAITVTEQGARLTLDKGKCIMCAMCQEIAPELFKVEGAFAQPVRARSDLIVASSIEISNPPRGLLSEEIGMQLGEKIRRVLGQSLAIREVDAGSCNGCEVEVSALNNPIYDIERFGVHFVASPRHADVLLVTGVASRNMEQALRRTYDATPDPKIVVAVGACACTGGLFSDTYASSGGITKVIPVDVFVPGCPPRPEALLYGLLLAVDRIGKQTKQKTS